jgi:hypothetical protein
VREAVRKIPPILVALLLLAPALGQSATDRADVEFVWRVPDRIWASGSVTVTFDTETANGYGATTAGTHQLEYANNQTLERKITIQTTGTLPNGLTLTASAAPNAGDGFSVAVSSSPRDLITAIPSGTTDGSATISFDAEADGPVDGATITIMYTISAGR